MKLTSTRLGVFLAFLSALLFSTKAVFVKLAYQFEVDAITLLILRMGFALPFYLLAFLFTKPQVWNRWKSIPIKRWIGLFISAALGYYLASLLDFLGLQYIDASLERLILFIYPTFVLILAFLWFRETINRFQIYAIALSYLGLIFVFAQHLHPSFTEISLWKGVIYILLCALCFALFLILSQRLIPSFGATSFTSITMIIACFLVILHFSMTRSFELITQVAPSVYLYALAMACLATVLPSYLVNHAIRHIGAAKVAIIASVGPVSTIALAYFLLGERLFPAQLFGGLLIIIGVTVVSFQRRKQKSLSGSGIR